MAAELNPRQKRRIKLAFMGFFIVVAVGSALFVFLFLGAEAKRLDALTPLRAGELKKVAEGLAARRPQR